jgi:hypothetical protein
MVLVPVEQRNFRSFDSNDFSFQFNAPCLVGVDRLIANSCCGMTAAMPLCRSALQVVLAALVVLAAAARGELRDQAPPGSRPHSVTITEFGAVGDGRTLNTVPFQNAVFYVRSFADKGGAQLYVPRGRWLTGSFNLTSHLTLYLEEGAVIIGAKVVWGH